MTGLPPDRPAEAFVLPLRPVRARLFPVWAAMSLLTALLCALLPAGLATSARSGSAFDPSTSVVSLGAPSGARLAAKRMQGDDPAGRSPSPILATGLAPKPVRLGAVAPRFASLPDLPPRPAAERAAWPRAPPAA